MKYHADIVTLHDRKTRRRSRNISELSGLGSEKTRYVEVPHCPRELGIHNQGFTIASGEQVMYDILPGKTDAKKLGDISGSHESVYMH